MSLHLGLAHRVSSLRDRLQETDPEEAHTAQIHMQQLQRVVKQVSDIQQRNGELAESLRDVSPASAATRTPTPQQLTWKARRLLLDAKEQIDELKRLGRELAADHASEAATNAFRHSLAISEMAVRAIQTLPDAGVDQLRLCDGVDSLLNTSKERVRGLKYWMQRQTAERDRVESLGCILLAMVQGRPIVWKALQEMAEAIVEENDEPFTLRVALGADARPEQRAAAHSLMVARVMARVARADAEWRGRRRDAVLAALVYDAGMAAMPPEILNLQEPITDEQRRQIESHVGLSADGVKRHAPSEGWLVEVVRAHHERLDGTGYPTGLQGPRIPRLARLLAVCDTYVALASKRSHRDAFSPRAALTETLLEAEKGRLDPALAEHLLELSFYPVGTAVELSGGQTGVVVAVNRIHGDVNAPARPVVQILLDEQGQPLPWPTHINLAESQGCHIVRSLTPEECRLQLGARHWHFL